MMNYVGSISIIDRGDAPAQAVIDKNVRSLAQRVADETKDELDKVMDRVDNIYVSYEMSTQTMFENPRASPNVEYIEDIKELEEIIKDTVKKKKYQQQVTIFIVGFQDACSEKMQLLQQVNQFFLDNSKLDEEDLVEEKTEIDLDDCSNKINESLKTAEDLTKRLSDLNQDIIEWLVNYANTKASNKGKKRLEKSLETAKNDMNALQEKLLNLQTELEEKDEKFQSLAKQLDAKTQESVRYKTAAEVAKKSAQDNESHTSVLQNEISVRDEKIKELRQKLTRLEINLTESQFDSELHQKRLTGKQMEAQHRLESLQEEVESKKIAVVEAEREMERLHREQLQSLDESHRQEIEELKTEHMAELTRLTDHIKNLHSQLSDAERHAQQAFDETDQLRATIIELQLGGEPSEKPKKDRPHSGEKQSFGKSYGDQSAGEEEHPTSKQESRPSTKDTKSSKRSEVKAKIPSRSPNRIAKEKSGVKTTASKEYVEASIQDEEGDHLKAFVQKSNENSRQPTRQSKNLQPVEEVNIDFQDVFDLDDEESWASVPAQHIPGRFTQYRKLSTTKVKELQDQLNITLTKTHRKVNSLKSQFTEHKKKWESERKVLIEQVEQAQKLQTEAEKEADAAMTQLEEFINEQEKLEDEEETKRQEVLKSISRPGTVGPTTPIADGEEKGTEGGQKDQGTGEEIMAADGSDQELKKLMQQTDDAKVDFENENGEHSSDVESRTGTAMTYDSGASQLAPWLTPIGVVRKPPGREERKSSSESTSDPFSRLTFVADAEIQDIVPGDEKEILAIEDGRLSQKLPDIYDGKSRSVSRLDRQSRSRPTSRMASGFKSRSSTKLPQIHTSVHIDEEEEELAQQLSESEEEWDENGKLAPWLTPAGKRKSRRSVRSRSRSPRSQMASESVTEESDENAVRTRARSLRSSGDTESRSRKHPNKSSSSRSILQEKSQTNLETDQSTTDAEKEYISESEPDKREKSVRERSRSYPLAETPHKSDRNEAAEPRSKSVKETSRTKDLKHEVPHSVSEGDGFVEKYPEEKQRARSPGQLVKQEKSMAYIGKSQPEKEISKERSLPKRTMSSFEKPNSPEARPASFRSERLEDGQSEKYDLALSERNQVTENSRYKEDQSSKHKRAQNEKDEIDQTQGNIAIRSEINKDAQKDSGIEQSEVSDAPIGKVSDGERTRTVLSRSARSRNYSAAKSRQKLEIPVIEQGVENKSHSRSHSKSKSIPDEDKIEYLDDGVYHENKPKSASRKTSLQEADKSPRLSNDSTPLDIASPVDGVEDDFEEELNLPGLSVIGGESVTDDVKTSRASKKTPRRQSDPVEQDTRKSKMSSVFNEQESVRNGAQVMLGKYNQETPHTIQSERRPSPATVSTVSPRKMMVVTVDVLAGSEAQASRTSGAISAPPAVEPDEGAHQLKEPDTVREDYESHPDVAPSRMRTVTPSTESEISGPPSATPKRAFATPRQPTVSPPSLRLSPSSSSIMSEVDLDIDEGVDLDLAPTQSDALNNLKKMMSEENLTTEQQHTLDSMRSAIKSVTDHEALKDIQLERTVTILSLASQLARESVELGIMPGSIFNSFANADSRAMSALTDRMSAKGWSSETGKILRSGKSGRREPVIVEQQMTDRTDREEIDHKQADTPFKIVMDGREGHSKSKTGKHQEVSTRHQKQFLSKERQPSATKERKQKEKQRKKEKSDLTLSGSMEADMDFCSSRGLDSFSDSLPRTVPSAEWQEMSEDETFSPVKPVMEWHAVHESRKDLVTRGTQYEFSDDELKIVGKGMFTSSPKKKRPITKEEMLYGETSMHVGPTGDGTELDIMMMDETSISSSRSDKQLSEKDSSLSLASDLHKDVSLPRTPKSVTRSSRVLTPKSPSSQRSRSLMSSADNEKAPSRQASDTPSRQTADYTPVTPGYTSGTPFTRPVSPESFLGEPSFLTGSMSHQVLVTTPTPDRTAPNSPIHRPLSISSVHPAFDLSPPPELCKATQTEPMKWSEVFKLSKIEHEPVVGKTEEEIRVSSAKSRASLRNQFKSRLEETRNVVEDRRAKSPAISVPSQKSLEDDQLIIDDDDDDLPIPDDLKVEDVVLKEDLMDAGTSPPPGAKPDQHVHTQVSRTTSKQSVRLAEHPVVQEYLKTYRGIHNFKDTISRLLEDKDQMSASQILADLDTVPFDQSTKVQPQLENMTENVYYVLNEVSQVVNSIIHNDRGPVVSSLMMGMSRDPTQRSMIKERSSESVDLRQGTQQSQRSVKVGPSPGVDKQVYRELQEKYETLQGQLSEEARKYEEQLRHNTVVMMEMQDTINDLQRELSALGKTPRRPMSDSVSTPGGGSQTAESAVMFTRLDSDRNAKIMKKAVIDEKLDPGSYKEAMVQMDNYVNLPAQRFCHLVRKYVHHCRMKEIEENVKKSKSLNENVFNILDKMEELQNQRAKRWADRMDEMGIERLRIASQLMETLDTIEQQSGIFLIKPMYSYRGREPKEHYSGKISRPFRPTRALSPLRDVQSAYAPAPTPASNMRAVVRAQGKQPEPAQISQEQQTTVVRTEPARHLEGDSQGLMGSSVTMIGSQPKATWSMSDSQPRVDGSLMMANLNTPRILELDINRMMIGQNTISAQIGSQGVSNDRLVNASNNNLRSYMTVNRPSVGPGGSAKGERPHSGNRQQDSPARPSSPIVTGSGKGVRIPNDQFSSTPPLPPIGTGTLQGRVTPKGNKGRQSPGDPSQSPSSLRHTPPSTKIDVEIIHTIK